MGSGAQASGYGARNVCPSSCSWNWASAWFGWMFGKVLDSCASLQPRAQLEQELFPEALGGASEKSVLTEKRSWLLQLRFWGAPDHRLRSDQCLMASDQTYPPCTHPIQFQLTYPLGLRHISSKLFQFNYSFCGKTSFFCLISNHLITSCLGFFSCEP